MASIRIFERLTNKEVPYTDAEILRLRSFTAFRVVRELRIRPWRVPWMLVRGRALMKKDIGTIAVFEGIEEILKQLKAADIQMYIMSSNSPGNIHKLLQAKGYDGYFRHVYGNVGIFGKAKMLRRVIGRNKFDITNTYYVGDEGRDIEAAKRVGVHSIAVGWGFNSPELLAKHHPTLLARTPQDLAKQFKELIH